MASKPAVSGAPHDIRHDSLRGAQTVAYMPLGVHGLQGETQTNTASLLPPGPYESFRPSLCSTGYAPTSSIWGLGATTSSELPTVYATSKTPLWTYDRPRSLAPGASLLSTISRADNGPRFMETPISQSSTQNVRKFDDTL
jgi:hypothetical protein